MVNLRLSLSVILFLLCNACASNDMPMLTDEKFDSRQNDAGQTEFAFGIAWQNSAQSSRQRDNNMALNQSSRDSRFTDARNDGFTLQANNQTKLDIEDLAALALKQKLVNENLCLNGYEISDVFWKNQSIRLLGFCL